MTWQQLILIQTCIAAIYTLLFRSIAKDHKSILVAAQVGAYNFVSIFCFGILWLILTETTFPSLPTAIHLYAFNGLLFASFSIFAYKVFTELDAAFGSIAIMLTALSSVIFGFVVLGEVLTVSQLLGSGLLLGAIVTANVLGSKHNKDNPKQLIIAFWVVGAAIIYGLAASIEKQLVLQDGLATYLLFGWAFQLFGAVIAFLIIKVLYVKDKTEDIVKPALVLGFLRGVAGLAFISAQIAGGPIGVLSSVSNFRVVIITGLAAIFLHERERLLQKLALCMVATIGLWLSFR